MRKNIAFIFIFSLITSGVLAADCPIGYVPTSPAYVASAKDFDRMELSESDRAAVEDKGVALRTRESDLQADYHDNATRLTLMLTEGQADRSRADILVSRIGEILAELNDMRVAYAFEMNDILKVRNLRKVRSRAPAWKTNCDPSIPVLRMRLSLTGAEMAILALTEDELKYLKDFDRREEYFRAEQQALRQRLGIALQAREIDRNQVKELLGRLTVSIRQQSTNRLDRYFYAEKVLFSPERMQKLNSYRLKHMKRVKPVKRNKK